MGAEEDDFEFGKSATDVDAAKGADDDPKEEKEEKEPEEKAKEEKSEMKSNDDDFSDDEPAKKEEEKKEEPAKKEEEKKEEEKEEDFFAGDDEPVKTEANPTFDVKDLAKDFEIEAEDINEFKTKLTEKIEKSKQEFKIDSLTPDAQSLVKHLNENGGKVDDFFTNPEIIQLQSVIAMDAEDKAIYVTSLTYQNGKEKLSPEDAQEKAEADIKALSTRQIKDLADQVDENAKGMIKASVDKIVGERDKIVEKQRLADAERVKQEVKKIESYVTDQADFLGLKLSDKAKASIVQDIRTGKFDQIANTDPVKAKFTAYMFNKYGEKLNDTIKTKLSDANRKGYNAALDKSLEALHKTKGEAQGKNVARQAQNKGTAKNFESWAGEFSDE